VRSGTYVVTFLPQWHVGAFDRHRIRELFPPLRLPRTTFSVPSNTLVILIRLAPSLSCLLASIAKDRVYSSLVHQTVGACGMSINCCWFHRNSAFSSGLKLSPQIGQRLHNRNACGEHIHELRDILQSFFATNPASNLFTPRCLHNSRSALLGNWNRALPLRISTFTIAGLSATELLPLQKLARVTGRLVRRHPLDGIESC